MDCIYEPCSLLANTGVPFRVWVRVDPWLLRRGRFHWILRATTNKSCSLCFGFTLVSSDEVIVERHLRRGATALFLLPRRKSLK